MIQKLPLWIPLEEVSVESQTPAWLALPNVPKRGETAALEGSGCKNPWHSQNSSDLHCQKQTSAGRTAHTLDHWTRVAWRFHCYMLYPSRMFMLCHTKCLAWIPGCHWKPFLGASSADKELKDALSTVMLKRPRLSMFTI